jgi:hypothetical protein
MTMNIESIAVETGLTGPDLADELVARGVAGNYEQALLMVDIEVDGGTGDVEVI